MRFGLDHHLHEFISHICERPQMYTRNGTFGEVAAWLDGYMEGSGAEGAVARAELGGFQHWLQQKLGYPTGCLWADIINQAFPEDQALMKLQILFDEYKSSETQGESASPGTGF